MAKKAKLDLRPRYIKELMRTIMFMGYKVTESGVVYNSKGNIVKPKFKFKNKRIDYVYIDITYQRKKIRMSYHRFIYLAWNQDKLESLDGMVITTIGRRFDYRLANLKAITREEHIANLAKNATLHTDAEIDEIASTYRQVVGYITITDFAERVGVSVRTLDKYLRKDGGLWKS